MNVLNRALTVAALVALAVILGVWLSRSPSTAAPPPASVAPTLALPPIPITPAALAIIEVPVEVEIASPAVAAQPAEPKPELRCCHPPRRRGLFGRLR